MSQLTIVQGDATQPTPQEETAVVYLPHVCNDIGGWGSGFVNAITARWGDSPRGLYKMWFEGKTSEQIKERLKARNRAGDGSLLQQTRFCLGGTQLLQLPTNELTQANSLVLVNMIGQHGVRGMGNDDRPPIRYGAMAKAMYALGDFIEQRHTSVDAVLPHNPPEIHAPRFGSDLAGGDFGIITSLIRELWVDRGIPVTIYEWVPKT